MIKNLFFDFHGTLTDFNASETAALILSGRDYHLNFSEKQIMLYKTINSSLWEKFNAGKITREQVFSERFAKFFNMLSISINPEAFNDVFLKKLGHTLVLQKNAREALSQLSNKYKLFVITNGIQETVIKKLNSAGILNFIDEVYTSERCHFSKPSLEFFLYCLTDINAKANECLIIGDSLTADIQGGIDSGILTCWFNFEKKKNTTYIKPDFEVCDFKGLISLLSSY